MKRCPTCQEEFADKFGFCPVDGTPLSNGFNAATAESFVASRTPQEESGVAYTPAHEATDAGETTWATDATRAEASDNGAAAAAAGASRHGYGAGREREEYHLTMLEDQGLVRRLTTEVRSVGHEAGLTWPEFKRDPGRFIKRGASAYSRAFFQFISQPNVAKGIIAAFAGIIILAGLVAAFDSLQSRRTVSLKPMIIGFIALALCGATAAALDRMRAKHTTAVVGIIASLAIMLSVAIGYMVYANIRAARALAADKVREDLEYQGMITDIPEEQKKPDDGPAGTNKGKGGGSKPEFERPHGGGGGGRQETKPASFGKLPPASMTIPQVVAPDPHPPVIQNPHR